MPSNDYLIKSQPESTLVLSANTSVAQAVGLCYFDPVDESLKELSSDPNHVMTIQPFKKAIRKYYLVIDDASGLTTISVQPVFGSLPSGTVIDQNQYYSLKTIISMTEPTLSQFDDQASMDEATITGFTTGQIYPVWILLQSKTPLNMTLSLNLNLDYE